MPFSLMVNLSRNVELSLIIRIALEVILAGVPVPESSYLLRAPLRAWGWFLRTCARCLGGRRGHRHLNS
jgi:hypothetical protein